MTGTDEPRFSALGALDWRVAAEGPDQVDLSFPWVDDLANPDGVLHGGAAAASLEEALTRLARFALGGPEASGRARDDTASGSPQVLERRISFERAGRGRTFSVRARLLRRGRRTAFLEAALTDDAGDICARAEAIACRMPGSRPGRAGDAGSCDPEGFPVTSAQSVRTLRAEILARPNPYRDRVGVRLAMPDAGRSVFWLDVDDRDPVGCGPVHAGILLTMLDLGMGHALLAGIPAVTRPITLSLEATTPVECRATRLIGRGMLRGGLGRSAETGLYDVEAEIVDADGRTQARGRAVFQGR